MKHLMTLVALLVSTAAVAQIPNYLPYNPDSNSDYFIGLPDLLELLVVYGSEWENGELIVSADSTSAIIYAGALFEHECIYACSALSGNWDVASKKTLFSHGPQLEAFYGTEMILLNGSYAPQSSGIWYRNPDDNTANLIGTRFQGWYDNDGPEYGISTAPLEGGQVWINGAYFNNADRHALDCWCSAEVAPKIEYEIINSAGMTIPEATEAANQLASEGWYLLETDSDGKTYFWRFAQ